MLAAKSREEIVQEALDEVERAMARADAVLNQAAELTPAPAVEQAAQAVAPAEEQTPAPCSPTSPACSACSASTTTWD